MTKEDVLDRLYRKYGGHNVPWFDVEDAIEEIYAYFEEMGQDIQES